jgi:hypothetical protein
MTIKILDGVSKVTPALARAGGYSAQLAYLAGNDAIDEAWVQACAVDDFPIGSLWELNPGAVALGQAQGTADAVAAVKAAVAIKQPRGTAIYAACDTDPAGLPGGPAGAVPYYRGFAYVRAAGYLAGAYIGAAGANECLAVGVVDRVFIPYASAWADGETPKREDVAQGYPYVVIGGQEYDPDTANQDTVGLWTLRGPWPVPAPKPKPAVTYVDIAPAPNGNGYHVLRSDGSVATFGPVRNFGDLKTRGHNGVPVAIATSQNGDGYWIACADGGVFSFGNAPFHGSAGGDRLHAPVRDFKVVDGDRGYVLVAEDGGVFAFGAAVFYGSAV